MKHYLDDLYHYVQEQHMAPYLSAPLYRRRAQAVTACYWQLQETLTPEQRASLDRLRDAEAQLSDLEGRALFREALALGKWMAR